MENGIINLCNGHDRSVFVPEVCCLRSSGSMAHRLRRDVSLIDMRLSGNIVCDILRLSTLFKKKKPNIIHTHGFGGGSLFGIVGAKLGGVPVIINGEHGTFFLKKHQVLLQRLLASFCNLTLSVSESLKRQVVANLGIAPDRIKVIPNGVDTQKFSGTYNYSYLQKELKKKYNVKLNQDTIVIGSVGSLKPEKNQIMLLRALNQIKEKNYKVFKRMLVVFVGEGEGRKKLEQFASSNSLSSNVVFWGKRDDVPQLLSMMNFLVSTSIAKHEGMSNVILEAYASKLPVIATKSVGTEELVKDGVTGFLVNEDDVDNLAHRILLLANNRDLVCQMGEEAREIAERKYSLSGMIHNYEFVYLSLLNS